MTDLRVTLQYFADCECLSLKNVIDLMIYSFTLEGLALCVKYIADERAVLWSPTDNPSIFVTTHPKLGELLFGGQSLYSLFFYPARLRDAVYTCPVSCQCTSYEAVDCSRSGIAVFPKILSNRVLYLYLEENR